MQYRSRLQRYVEIAAIGLFAILTGGFVWRLAGTVDGWPALCVFIVSLVAGYTLADLVSGIVHWLGDRYGRETMPIIGPVFVRPFREHHSDPKAITRHGFIETNGSNCMVCAPFMGIAFLVLPTTPSLMTTFFLGGTLAFCHAIFATNQFHKWAHMDHPPRLAQRLRSASLILTPEHHGLHHSPPFDRNYCITAGWWNPLIDRLKLFEWAESSVLLVTRARPVTAMETPRQVEPIDAMSGNVGRRMAKVTTATTA